jgi:hypothetical protein
MNSEWGFIFWPGSLDPKLLCEEFNFPNAMLSPTHWPKNNQKSYFTIIPN